eukprot:403336029
MQIITFENQPLKIKPAPTELKLLKQHLKTTLNIDFDQDLQKNWDNARDSQLYNNTQSQLQNQKSFFDRLQEDQSDQPKKEYLLFYIDSEDEKISISTDSDLQDSLTYRDLKNRKTLRVCLEYPTMHRPVEQFKNLINQHRNVKKQRRLLREQKLQQKAQQEQKRQFEQSLRFAIRQQIKNSIVQEIQQEIVRKSYIDSRKSSTDSLSQNQEVSRNIQSQFDEEFVNGLTSLFKYRKVNDVQVNVQQEPVSYQENSVMVDEQYEHDNQSFLDQQESVFQEIQGNDGVQVQNQEHKQVEAYIEKNESFFNKRVEVYMEKNQSFYDQQNQINQSSLQDNCFKDSMAKVTSLQDLIVKANLGEVLTLSWTIKNTSKRTWPSQPCLRSQNQDRYGLLKPQQLDFLLQPNKERTIDYSIDIPMEFPEEFISLNLGLYDINTNTKFGEQFQAVIQIQKKQSPIKRENLAQSSVFYSTHQAENYQLEESQIIEDGQDLQTSIIIEEEDDQNIESQLQDEEETEEFQVRNQMQMQFSPLRQPMDISQHLLMIDNILNDHNALNDEICDYQDGTGNPDLYKSNGTQNSDEDRQKLLANQQREQELEMMKFNQIINDINNDIIKEQSPPKPNIEGLLKDQQIESPKSQKKQPQQEELIGQQSLDKMESVESSPSTESIEII